MKSNILFILFLFTTVTVVSQSVGNNKAHGVSSAVEGIRGSGMTFTQNKGQIVDMQQHPRPDILYKGSGGGTDVYLRKTGISYVLSNMGQVMHEVNKQIEELKMTGIIHKSDEQEKKLELLKKQTYSLHRVDVDFVNCNADAKVITSEQIEGYTNYYYAHCPDGITNVNSYNEITVKNIYNNIDVKYYAGKEKGMKYDIVVNPGADPSQIKLKYSGAKSVELLDGKLRIESSIGLMNEYMPKVYQNINGKNVDVAARYVLNGTTLNFELGTLNPLFPLVIDPWVSYYGGSTEDMGSSVATDPSGNVIFAGYTASLNFPVQAGFQTNKTGGTFDAFIVKMNSAGSRLWATYYGGSDYEDAMCVATDPAGNILVTGTTSSTNFPIGQTGANVVHQAAYGGYIYDAFLLKFDPSGGRLWSTFYGGDSRDRGTGVVATIGNVVYLYGETESGSGISTSGSFQAVYNNLRDVFIAKFTSTGARVWGTYYGGSYFENSSSITCDNTTGDIYATGETWSVDFPVSTSAHQNVFGGFRDAFIIKLDPAGKRLWATYYGGTGVTFGYGITCDNNSNIIIGGNTTSPTGIATGGSFQPIWSGTGGNWDAFIAKFNSSGVRQWGTYLGGSAGLEWISALDVDADNNIYAYGEWEDGGQNYPASPCAYQDVWGGGPAGNSTIPPGNEDQFIAKYAPSGIQTCITYMGGTGHDDLDGALKAMAIYGNFIYITGGSIDGAYPVTPGAFQTVFSGWVQSIQGYYLGDAIIAQLCINICEAKVLGLNYSANTTNVCINKPVTFSPSVSNSCDNTGQTYKWTFTGGTPSNSSDKNPTVTYPVPGTYQVKLVLTTPCKKDSIIKPSYITVNSCGCVMSASATVNSNIICGGGSNGSANITITNGSGGTYTYSWSNGTSGTTTANTIPITGLSVGTYTVTITDGSCSSISSVTLTQSLNLNSISSANVTCNNGNNGSATVTISGAGGSYTYNWSTGASAITNSTSHQVTNLSSGTYTVTISQGSCISISSVTITDPPAIVLGYSAKWSCLTNTGTATVYPSNGNNPYTYLWSNSQTTATITGLSLGIYSVTTTDANGCKAAGTTTIVNRPIVFDSVYTQNITCTAFGAISIVKLSGTGPLTYIWSNGASGTYAGGQFWNQRISAGIYTITVTDASSCSATKSFTITSTSPASADFTFPTPCVGKGVTFTNTGTTGTYDWVIAPLNVSGSTTDFSYTFLTAGTYTVTHTVTTSGCSNTVAQIITVANCSSGPTVTTTANSVCPGSCASVTSTASGGTGPYTYAWSNGATTQNINPCPAITTTYTVTIKDSGGNTSTSTAVVTVNPAVAVGIAASNITCNGGTNGSATATGNSGTSPYVYNWSNLVSGSQVSGLAPGTYTVTVTDSKGCTSTSTTTIVAPQPLAGQFTKGTASCPGCSCKQWILVNATGGTNPYSYTWPDGYVNRYKNNLCPGSYTINIKDKNGCSVNVNLSAP